MTTDTIVEFLLARIDGDEVRREEIIARDTARFGGVPQYRNVPGAPDRISRECAAKRAIVEAHHPDRPLENWYWLDRKCAECGETWHEWVPHRQPTDIGPEKGCRTLRTLAAVYSDHPDYRQEWAV